MDAALLANDVCARAELIASRHKATEDPLINDLFQIAKELGYEDDYEAVELAYFGLTGVRIGL